MLNPDQLTYVHRIQHVPVEVDAGVQSQPWETFLSGLAEYGLSVDSTGRLHLQGENRFRFFNSMVLASETTDQTLTTATVTPITFDDADVFDTDNLHDLVTNNTRLTAAIAGKYIVTAFARFDANATGQRTLFLEKNADGTHSASAVFSQVDMLTTGSTLATTVYIAGFIDLAASDRVEVFAYQNSGGDLAIKHSVVAGKFGMVYVGE